MGVGIIGAASGAAEALPFGAGALVTSGFVNGTTFNYTATVNPGRYIIEGSTADGDSPVIAYAPNSNTTAIAYPGKSAILNVTQTESVIRLSAIPLVGNPLPGGHGTSTQGNRVWYRLNAYAQSADGVNICQGISFNDGSWRSEIWTSNNSGASWNTTLTRSGDSIGVRSIEFIPDNGGYFLAAIGDNNIYRSINGNNWGGQSYSGNLGDPTDFLNLGGGVVLIAHASGISRSADNGVSWSQVFSGPRINTLVRIEGPNRILGTYENGMVWSGDGISWANSNLNGNFNASTNAFRPIYGLAALRNHAVAGCRWDITSDFQGSGFSLFDSFGNPLSTAFQAPNGETVYRGSTADNSGAENHMIVKMYENRGFILSIGSLTGALSFSTDGHSWNKVGQVAGMLQRWYNMPNNHGYPKFQSNVLTVTTNATGGASRYTNRFAYKIFASTI